MHKNLHSMSDLLAQTPSLFGFSPQNSILLYFMKDTNEECYSLGPTIRLDFPTQDTKGALPYSVDSVLKRLSTTGCDAVVVAIIREGWGHPSTFRMIEFIDQCLEFIIDDRGYRFYDMVALEDFAPGTSWASVRNGVRGTVSEAKSSPLALERYWEGIDIHQSRSDTRKELCRHIDDEEIASEWRNELSSMARRKEAGEISTLYDFNIAYLDYCVGTAPTAEYGDEKVRHIREYLLTLIDTYQGSDGLMSLLTADNARQWVEWMWELTPTFDEHDKAIMLFVVAVWYYIRGDGFRCTVLLERAQQSGAELPGVDATRQLLELCVEPAKIMSVVQGISDKIQKSA